jgi:dihydrofolate reductase
MKLALIAAVAENRVIGADGAIPWDCPADLRHFRETTLGHPVILGRRTFKGVLERNGGPLSGRTNVVLTTRPETLPDDVVGVDAIDDAVRESEATGADVAYVAGGATVYRQFLPHAHELVLTEIPGSFEGDAYFPDVRWERWTETSRTRLDRLSIVTYRPQRR